MDERLIGIPDIFFADRCINCGAIDKIVYEDCKYCKKENSMTWEYKYWELNHG